MAGQEKFQRPQIDPICSYMTLICHYYNHEDFLGQTVRTVMPGLRLSVLIIDLMYGRRRREPSPQLHEDVDVLQLHNYALADIFSPCNDWTRKDEDFIERATSVRVMSIHLWRNDSPLQ